MFLLIRLPITSSKYFGAKLGNSDSNIYEVYIYEEDTNLNKEVTRLTNAINNLKSASPLTDKIKSNNKKLAL